MNILEKHQIEYGQKPQAAAQVPAILTIFGEFADYCNGYVLCAASNAKLEIAVSVRPDSMVRILNTFSNDHKRFNLSGIKFRREDRWGNYVKGVISEIQGGAKILPGLNITLSGSLLACDGQTVSSAVGIGICLVLNQLCDLKMDYKSIAIATFASCTRFCGEICSYTTLLSMLSAKQGKFLFFDLQKVFEPVFIDNFLEGSDFSLLLIDSSIPPLAMREELLHKHKVVKNSMAKLRQYYQHGSFRDFPESELKDRITPLDEESRRICSHILEECHVTHSVLRLLKLKDFFQLGKAFGKMQKGLRDCLELTCPEVDWLIKRASESSACYGSCMVHTGISGTVLLLIKTQGIDSYLEKMEDYEHIFGFKVKSFLFTPEGCASLV